MNKRIIKPILIFYPKIKITERHLPSFVVLVDQTPVCGPPEAKMGGAGPTESCLPTHRESVDRVRSERSLSKNKTNKKPNPNIDKSGNQQGQNTGVNP